MAEGRGEGLGCYQRKKRRLLAEPQALGEAFGHQGRELVTVELLHVELVGMPAPVAVLELVRTGEDQHAVGLQQPRELRQELLLLADVLDGLEGNSDVDARVGERQARA